MNSIKRIAAMTGVLILSGIGAYGLVNGLGVELEMVTHESDSAGAGETTLARAEFAGADSAATESTNPAGATVKIGLFGPYEDYEDSAARNWTLYR
jgi:hypothetical protein